MFLIRGVLILRKYGITFLKIPRSDNQLKWKAEESARCLCKKFLIGQGLSGASYISCSRDHETRTVERP